jgi:hypothetical protein
VLRLPGRPPWPRAPAKRGGGINASPQARSRAPDPPAGVLVRPRRAAVDPVSSASHGVIGADPASPRARRTAEVYRAQHPCSGSAGRPWRQLCQGSWFTADHPRNVGGGSPVARLGSLDLLECSHPDPIRRSRVQLPPPAPANPPITKTTHEATTRRGPPPPALVP